MIRHGLAGREENIVRKTGRIYQDKSKLIYSSGFCSKKGKMPDKEKQSHQIMRHVNISIYWSGRDEGPAPDLPRENAWSTGLHMEQKPDFTAAPQVAEAEQKGG